MGNMSKNFNKSEFACHGLNCCGGKSEISKDLVAALQKLRDLIGKPIKINSGYRCKKHNENVGGAPNSFHVQGLAADISVNGMTIEELKDYVHKIPEFENGGIGLYKRWIHVDIRKTKARWDER